MKYFIYVRKSTESEDRQVLSIEAQIKELQSVAKRFDIKVVNIFKESKSAKEPGRPIFNDMMKGLQNGDAQGVLYWKLDRLARNPIDGATIIWAIKQHKIKVTTPAQNFSQDNENTILMYIEFGMAQKYIDDLSKNITRGVRMKLEKGGWPTQAPPGYLNDKLEKIIIKDPERFQLVRKMWDLMLTGCYSVESIVTIANTEWGYRTRPTKRLGGRPMVKSGLYKIFINPFYSGYMQHKMGIYKGNHEPMITQSEYDRVQELLGRNDRNKSKKYYFPYAGGFIKCGECGFSVTAEFTTNRHGQKYCYYHCSKKSREIRCRQGSIEVNKLEGRIIEFIKSLQVPQSFADWLLAHVSEADNEQQLIDSGKIESLKKTTEDIEKQIAELNRMRYRKLLDDEEYLKEKEMLSKEKQGFEQKLETANIAGANSFITTFKKTLSFTKHAPQWFEIAQDEQKRMIIDAVGSNPTLIDKNLLIQAQIPFILFKKLKNFHMVENGRFEPRNFGLDKTKTASFEAARSSMSREKGSNPLKKQDKKE